MAIEFNSKTGVFHLNNQKMSYVFCVLETAQLAHLYWGRRIRNASIEHISRPLPRAFSAVPAPEFPNVTSDTLLQECPTYGRSDMRQPICHLQNADGSTVCDLRYVSHRIFAGKPRLEKGSLRPMLNMKMRRPLLKSKLLM